MHEVFFLRYLYNHPSYDNYENKTDYYNYINMEKPPKNNNRNNNNKNPFTKHKNPQLKVLYGMGRHIRDSGHLYN